MPHTPGKPWMVCTLVLSHASYFLQVRVDGGVLEQSGREQTYFHTTQAKTQGSGHHSQESTAEHSL